MRVDPRSVTTATRRGDGVRAAVLERDRTTGRSIRELELIEPRDGRGPRAHARVRRVPLRPARPRWRMGSTDADRHGPRRRRRRRGGRAGRDLAAGRRTRRAVVADPVRRLPFVPSRPRCGRAPTRRPTATRCSTANGFTAVPSRASAPTARSRRWPRRRSCRLRRPSRSPTASIPAVGGTHRLLRDDRRRGGAQDRRGPCRFDRSR